MGGGGGAGGDEAKGELAASGDREENGIAVPDGSDASTTVPDQVGNRDGPGADA